MFDPLDWIVIVGSVLSCTLAILGIVYWAGYRRPRGPGQRLVSRGAGRIFLRNLTHGGDIHRWN